MLDTEKIDVTVPEAQVIEMGLRASNLVEQIRIVDAGAADGSGHRPDLPDPLELRRITALTEKLAAQLAQEAEHRSMVSEYSAERLRDIVLTFRRLDVDGTSPSVVSELRSLHRSWLPTYRAAIQGAVENEAPENEAWWKNPDVYYGRLGIVCAPFLQFLRAEIDVLAPQLGAQLLDVLLRDAQKHLIDRFELAMAWAVEVQAKVHCAQQKIAPGDLNSDDFCRFLDQTFDHPVARHQFYLQFPMLGRWLAQVTRLLADETRILAVRLHADRTQIADQFFGRPIAAFTEFRFGEGDHHAGARSVVRVAVTLADGEQDHFVYKPRSVDSEVGLQRLLVRLNQDGVLSTPPREVISRRGYGYEALIPAGRNVASTMAEVEQVYRELGGYLALFYVLGGGDLHLENILVADGHVYICDCETVFGVVRPGEVTPIGSLLDSVFKTGMLEWPTDPGADPVMRISGYNGGEAYDLPLSVARISEQRLSFGMSVTYRSGLHVQPAGSNRVWLGDQLVQPQDHTDAVLEGFGQVYGWFQDPEQAAARAVTAAFTGASTRLIHWNTQLYGQLLAAVRHPRCLLDPLETDLVLNRLRTLPQRHVDAWAMVEPEMAALWRWDVPLFTVDVDRDELVSDHEHPVSTRLAMSPMAYTVQRIRSLSPENRSQQEAYVRASLATSTRDESMIAACVDHAAQIGERLVQMLRPESDPAPWSSFQVTGTQVEEVGIEADLYNGSAGVALYLAYLDQIRPDPTFRSAAERALDHVRSTGNRRQIGAFGGVAGMVYLLTHLATAWQSPTLLDEARDLVPVIDGLIDDDRHLDVLSGVAGVIPVLLGLAGQDHGTGLDVAVRCADHLLERAEADGESLSWPPFDPDGATANLTGLAHGAGGIGWALIRLGSVLDRPDYIEAGRRAFRYEARSFDPTARDWLDLRRSPGPVDAQGRSFSNSWCNGAAGIGFTRIAAWDLLGRTDTDLLKDAHLALSATMKNFVRLRNDTLCHGRSGNAELMLRFAELRDQPAFRMEANIQVQSQWRNFDAIRPGAAGEGGNFFPGLMLGISGFGLHYLRLSHPERVPSVLLLDPPPSSRKELF